MTLDLDALRKAAEMTRVDPLVWSINPAAVIALLDRLARAERLLAEYGVDVS